MCLQPQSCDLSETRGAWGWLPGGMCCQGWTQARWKAQVEGRDSISRALLVAEGQSGLQTQATQEVWSAEEEGSNPCNHTEIPR